MSSADLDMALVYVLDQVAQLESFVSALIKQFEIGTKRTVTLADHIPSFQPAINTVMNWSQAKQETRMNEDESAHYKTAFCNHIKSAMDGLLEPYGELLQEYGYF